ncbi:hypothetical protein CMQ_1193 [Grosmannia clavigera kw1407]|uniref:Uncharacterized protein n=1 Tax=Grosmannia clavigera (strain kw1407 / UAMH 11150) TaxID=655863 RepID=F0XCS2_GROCL|nr:uncharacterized protein CMQ_1193 [Grosmannia clavigera kw1407]EFX04265.1 hypothetical protein CMQ_1193 [Grosmannia clavigera kw1407]
MEDILNKMVLPQAKEVGGWFTELLFLLHMKEKPDTKNSRDQDSDQASDHAILPSHKSRQYRWSHVLSYLAVMGGFAFDNSHAPEKIPLPNKRARVTLTTTGILFLAKLEPDLIPDISEEQIRDKSKTNPLAKILTCLQALWFCAQVLSHLGQNLAVTLLELNTSAHALCALCVYFMWWNKPLDIVEPFSIDVQSDRAAALCAMFCYNFEGGFYHLCRFEGKPYQQHDLLQVRGRICLDLDELLQSPEQQESVNEQHVHDIQEQPEWRNLRYKNDEKRPYFFDKVELRAPNCSSLDYLLRYVNTIDFGSADVGRGNRRWPAYLLPLFFTIKERDVNLPYYDTLYHATLAVTSCVYGAWHLIAWGGPFRGRTEMVLWRGSAIGLATPTELSPPYLDIDTEAYMSASHLDGLLDNRGDGSSHLDSALAVNRVGVDTSTHLCSLAMVESARSEIVRFTTNELAPLRARLGQQILEVCFKLGKQVESLHAILSSFESDWDPESAGSYFDPALEEWLHCVKQVLVAMQAETESVALHSLDMDKDTRDDVVDGKTEEFLQCFYVRLVDHTDKMDDFLPIMILYAAPPST